MWSATAVSVQWDAHTIIWRDQNFTFIPVLYKWLDVTPLLLECMVTLLLLATRDGM